MPTQRSRSARLYAGFVGTTLVIAGSFIGTAAIVRAQQAIPECRDGADNDGNGEVDALVDGGNPNATTNVGGGNPFGGIRGFVNSFAAAQGFTPIPNSAAVHFDQASADKVCQLAGYKQAVSFDCVAPAYDNRCGYLTFGANQMYSWNGSDFVSVNDNKWISSVNCRGFAAACEDGKDNDGDGKKDMQDDGCARPTDGSEIKHDGRCFSPDDTIEGLPQCKDGTDNDGDGKKDFVPDGSGDPGCENGDDDDESNDPAAGESCDLQQSTCTNVPGAVACKNGACIDAQQRPIAGSSCTCTGATCSQGDLCGDGSAVCPDGQKVEWAQDSILCTIAAGNPPQLGRCYRCVKAEEDPPLCPVACQQDADCGNKQDCAKEQNPDGTFTGKDKCWLEKNVCVKKCLVPRCINQQCAMAVPVGIPTEPYLPCEGVNACPLPACGDGVVQQKNGEECDDGNVLADDGCNATCKKEVCGDGVLQKKGADGKPNTKDDEECDDGNKNDGDGCSNACTKEKCGNGVIDVGETCDDGPNNSDTKPGACRTTCVLPACNDGVVDDMAPWGEQCDCGKAGAEFDWEAHKDDPMSPYCEVQVKGHPALCHMGMCAAFFCGDGFQFNPGFDRESGTEDDEMCDTGPFNSDEPVGGGCVNNAQCPGAVCVAGECTEVNCSSSNECNGGKCVGGKCKPGGCLSDADCSSGRVCADDGSCKRVDNIFTQEGRCVDNNDCPSGYCHPSGSCMAEIAPDQVPDPTCRMDCKPVRCGDGIVDEGVGETCDEGQGMFRCNGYPQPACSCGIPSWGSLTRPMGTTFDTTCCPTNQFCTLWGSESCPSTCGVGGICGNGTVDPGEECDESSGTQTSDGKVAFTWRTNRDGTRTAFTEDDGKWVVVPVSEDDIFTAIDHEPEQGAESSDGSWIATSLAGTAKTYFHLWDITSLTSETVFSRIKLRIGVDFTGVGVDWKLVELDMVPIYHPSETEAVLYGNDMNAVILEIVADEDAHTLTFTLFHSSTGKPMTKPLVVASPVELVGRTKIAIDAMEIVTSGTSADQQISCEKCMILRCGNNVVEEGNDEECDDGNAENNDGCTDQCMLEICRLPSAE